MSVVGEIRRQVKLYKIKIIICDMQNSLDGINGTLNTAEENISEFEHISIEMTQIKNEEKNLKN